MPHKHKGCTSSEAVTANERTAGADLLLSLAKTATETSRSGKNEAPTPEKPPRQEPATDATEATAANHPPGTPENTGQPPIQPATEATEATATNHPPQQRPSLNGYRPPASKATSTNMQMSVLGTTGSHRMLVPSPIKLPKSEQRKRRTEQEHDRDHDANLNQNHPYENEQNEKEAAVSETNKKPRRDTLDQGSPSPTANKTVDHSSPTQEPYGSSTNTLISPASSNEGQKSPTSSESTAPSATTTLPPAGAKQQSLNTPHAPTPHYRPPVGAPAGAHYPSQYHPAGTPSNQPWLHPVSYYHHPMAPGGYAVPHHHAHHPYYAVSVPPPYGAPPPGAATHPPAASTSAAGAAASSKSKERETLKAEEVQKNIEEWQKTRATIGNKARCVPVENPTKARKLVPNPEAIDTKLPDFPLLVNFPEHLTRGQTRGTGESKGLAPEGKRHCVMCGLLRICSSSANRLNRSTAPTQADSTVHIIPRQNKGVCTACDVTVWTVKDVPELDIKWCKGCKNFRPWPAFGDKGMATKCARCRNRQREKYALQKKQGQYDFKKEDDILAAQGLSSMMRASAQNA